MKKRYRLLLWAFEFNLADIQDSKALRGLSILYPYPLIIKHGNGQVPAQDDVPWSFRNWFLGIFTGHGHDYQRLSFLLDQPNINRLRSPSRRFQSGSWLR